MIKSLISRTGIMALLGLSTLTSCGTFQKQSSLPYKVIDQTGHYVSRTPEMLKEAEEKTGMTFKGKRIVYLHPLNDIGSISELEEEMKKNDDMEATIAWTAYHKETSTAYIRSVIKKSPRWAIEHELGHAVLMSNGIGGHPAEYNNKFKYWRN